MKNVFIFDKTENPVVGALGQLRGYNTFFFTKGKKARKALLDSAVGFFQMGVVMLRPGNTPIQVQGTQGTRNILCHKTDASVLTCSVDHEIPTSFFIADEMSLWEFFDAKTHTILPADDVFFRKMDFQTGVFQGCYFSKRWRDVIALAEACANYSARIASE